MDTPPAKGSKSCKALQGLAGSHQALQAMLAFQDPSIAQLVGLALGSSKVWA